MKHSRLTILLIVAFLVAFQTVDPYSVNSLKETETEESASNECFVSTLLKQVPVPGEVGVALSGIKQRATVSCIAVSAFRKRDLFLQHCILRI